MIYIGTEGYLVNCGLWEGKQHCQKHTPGFLHETIRMCREFTDEPSCSDWIPETILERILESCWKSGIISL